MRERHCSDEALVALLDGELRPRAKRAAEAHLACCWTCRTRAAEWEKQIHSLATSLAAPSCSDANWVLDGRARFAEARRQIDLETHIPPPSLLDRWGWWKMSLAAACLIVLLAGTPLLRNGSTGSARAVANRVGIAEQTAFATPVHVVYDVAIVPVKPGGTARVSKVELWSDRPSNRFTWRWQNASGKLTNAVWQSGVEKQYAYDETSAHAQLVPAGQSYSVVSLSDLSSSDVEPEQVARMFLRWLQSRKWQPVSFAADMGTFVTAEGVDLNVERRRSEQGTPILRLTANRAFGNRIAKITIDVDAVSYRPVIQRIRLERGGRVVDLVLATRQVEFAPNGRFLAAVFEPEISLARTAPPAITGLRAAEAEPSRLPPSAAENNASRREIEVLYLLHRMNACEGNSLEVLPGPSGRLLVRGIVAEESRKQDLLAQLRQLPSAAQLDIEIQSSAGILESARSTAAPQGAALTATLEPIAGGRLAIEDPLRRYLAGSEGKATEDLDAQVSAFSGRVLSNSNTLLAEGWELHRLVEKLGEQDLDAHSRQMLESMLRDHLTSLQRREVELSGMLGPLLPVVAGVAAGSEIPRTAESGADLNQMVSAEFQAARRIHADIQVLFGGTSPPDRVEPAQLAAKQILRALAQLHGNLQTSEALLLHRITK